ncbi:MAG TPA: MarC family protein [Dehalococcoidia bacterium]|nr:MarC family protein [Dehalococcoidia bacterium]
MTEIIRAALGIFATLAPFGLIPAFLALPVNPAAKTDGESQARTLNYAAATSLAVLLLTVVVTDAFLGLIDVVPESFQAGAAVIMLPLAAQLLWTGRSMDPGERVTSRPWLMPLTFPGLVGPPSLAAVLAYTARYSELEAALATVLAVALAYAILWFAEPLGRQMGPLALGMIGRLSGAFIVVIALELVVDGVRSV